MSGFKAGQLVRVTDTESLAYGRVAMAMGGGQPTQAKLRFVDLPKMVEATDNLRIGVMVVETFNNSQLEAVEGIPIADIYWLITIDERNEGQQYQQHCLAHGAVGKTGEEVAQAISQCWYEDDDADGHGKWDEGMEAYVFFDYALSASVYEWREISTSEYINLRAVLNDRTPDTERAFCLTE